MVKLAHLLRVDQRCSQVPSGLLMLPGASNGPLMTNFASKKAKICERQSRAELALRSSMWRLVSTARIDHGSCKDPSWHLDASVSLQERWNSSSTATTDFALSRMTGQQHMADITTGACGDRSPHGEVAHLLRVVQKMLAGAQWTLDASMRLPMVL